MGLIKQKGDNVEGEIFCKWLYNRLIKNNKNVLGANLGATGSGKSYRDLRMAELWYQYHFKKPFPPDNICFGAAKLMEKLSSGKLKRGEILIFEEAGVNLGSLDFQTRVSKIFTYVLQSFRSMNVGIFFNLPYLSMLNKQARLLLHYSFESMGIDFIEGKNKCKPFFHQVNQSSGKIYKKYLRAKINGVTRTIKRFNFSMPSGELVSYYERMKAQFLSEITQEYNEELKQLEEEKLKKLNRPILTDKQKEVYDLLCLGLSQVEIAKRMDVTPAAITSIKQFIKKKGYLIEKKKKSPENQGNLSLNPLPTPS